MGDLFIKRIYDVPAAQDGYRVLIDRLWPRGISKGNAHLDEWMKTISPSDELRKWFGHDPVKFQEFKTRYKSELLSKIDELNHLKELLNSHDIVTLLYAAKDVENNNARVLEEVLKVKQE